MRLVPSIKKKLGDDQKTICNVLYFVGTPGNTFRYLLDCLHNKISGSLKVCEENHLLLSIYDKKIENQFNLLKSLTEDEGEFLERLGKCIVAKNLSVEKLVKDIFFNDNK